MSELLKRDDFYRRGRRYGLTRIGVRERDESPETILMRCALELQCEPRQVYDRLLERLKREAETIRPKD
jgi:hypothetical protein